VPGHRGASAAPSGGLTPAKCPLQDLAPNAISRSTLGAELSEPPSALLVVDDDRSQNNIMEEATAVIEKAQVQAARNARSLVHAN
jgi:hypothetical protein